MRTLKKSITIAAVGVLAAGLALLGAAPATAGTDPTAARRAARGAALSGAHPYASTPRGLGPASACSPGGTASSPRTGKYFDGDGVRIRTGPHTSCTAVGEGFRSQSVTLYCYTTGDSVGGDPYWDRLKDNATGKAGYASEVYLVIVPLVHC